MEVLQKISAAPLTDCPACQAPALKKLLSVPGFRLSGNGWYETDFKTGAKRIWQAATRPTELNAVTGSCSISPPGGQGLHRIHESREAKPPS